MEEIAAIILSELPLCYFIQFCPFGAFRPNIFPPALCLPVAVLPDWFWAFEDVFLAKLDLVDESTACSHNRQTWIQRVRSFCVVAFKIVLSVQGGFPQTALKSEKVKNGNLGLENLGLDGDSDFVF